MRFNFSKYAGSGNDFILVDARGKSDLLSPELVRNLCERKQGVGADGVIAWEEGIKAPYRMRIFNSDGSEAAMCGNGLRCFKKFLEECGVKEQTIEVETLARVHKVSSHGEFVKAQMGPPTRFELDFDLSGDVRVDLVNSGVPHAIQFVDSVDHPQVFHRAGWIRHHPMLMPEGANVNVAELRGTKLWVRTWERGVEGETLACGTGMTAAALAAAVRYSLPSPITVVPLSREEIQVEFIREDHKITESAQIGPARFIFQGSLHYGPQERQPHAR